MFAYILRVRAPDTPQSEDFFQRFTQEPGLVHAFEFTGVDDPEDGAVVAIWEDQAAAERYLDTAPLRQEVDQSMPSVTRTMYSVRGAK